MSYTAIATEVGLSEAAVRQRAQRLMEQGVMQIVAVTDPLQLGFVWEAMVGVRVSGNIEAIADTLGKIEAIDFIVLTSGRFDIILEVVAESDDQFIDLTDTIRSIPGVVGSETLVYLSTRKQAYSWGVR
jgi:Lrp/AsnC family transcriptional regulator for asnA, asnC and gidA